MHIDPAGSSWLYFPINVSVYGGEGVGGPYQGAFPLEVWLTTGFSENSVVEVASRLNGSYVNETGRPFNETSGIVSYSCITHLML